MDDEVGGGRRWVSRMTGRRADWGNCCVEGKYGWLKFGNNLNWLKCLVLYLRIP